MAALKSFPTGYRAVVVGTTGGIGQAFTTCLRADANCAELVALCRSTMPRLDLQDEASVEAAAKFLAQGGPVHLIIDATGILHDAEMKREKSIDAVDPANMARAFAINATGPLLLLKHFYRLLTRDERSVFATVSARVGSIGDNRLGGWYGYRASKAALNMFLRTAAIEIARKRPHAVCLALHPGRVKTGLSEPFSSSRKRFEPEQAASLLLNVINRATSDDTGSFLAYDGSVIPW